MMGWFLMLLCVLFGGLLGGILVWVLGRQSPAPDGETPSELVKLEADWQALMHDIRKPCDQRSRPPIILLALLVLPLSACSMTKVDRPYLLADGTVYQAVSARTHQDLGHGSEGYLLTAYHCQREALAAGEVLPKDQVIHALAYDEDGTVFRKDETTVPYKASNCSIDGQSAGGGASLSAIGLAGVTNAGGLIGAAAVLRPARTNVEQQGGGAHSVSTGGQATSDTSVSTTATGGQGGQAQVTHNPTLRATSQGSSARVGNVSSTAMSTGNRTSVGNTSNSSRNTSVSLQHKKRRH